MSKEKKLEKLPSRGVYTLIIYLAKDKTIKVGKLGERAFPKGFYAYTGSALGPHEKSLQKRVQRHLIKDKTMRWHIDYFLGAEKAFVTAVLAAETKGKLEECRVNKLIIERAGGTIQVKGFGASDCKEKCGSHLIFLGENKDVSHIISNLYNDCFSEVFMFMFRRKAKF